MGDDVAQLTLAEAAQAVGKSKSTVLRSIQAGRISAARDELSGGWLIEPDELHRVYGPLVHVVHDAPNGEIRTEHATLDSGVASSSYRELRSRLADAHEQITDLRRRLDRADEQRQQAQTQLAAFLADQRRSVPPRRSWWRWRPRRALPSADATP